jgi:Ca2+-binding EF-hand superfamily protein
VEIEGKGDSRAKAEDEKVEHEAPEEDRKVNVDLLDEASQCNDVEYHTPDEVIGMLKTFVEMRSWEKLYKHFKSIDKDRSGYVSKNEFQVSRRQLEFDIYILSVF